MLFRDPKQKRIVLIIATAACGVLIISVFLGGKSGKNISSKEIQEMEHEQFEY